jgi:hypothetical protein
MHDLFGGEVRVVVGKRRQASTGIMDSQSVEKTGKVGSGSLIRTNRPSGASATSLANRA